MCECVGASSSTWPQAPPQADSIAAIGETRGSMCHELPGAAFVDRFHHFMPRAIAGRKSSVRAATAVAPANVCVTRWNAKSLRNGYPASTSLSIATWVTP